MPVTEKLVVEALERVPYPGFSRDIVSLNAIQDLEIRGDHVTFNVVPGPGDPRIGQQIAAAARAAVEALDGVATVTVRVRGNTAGDPALPVAAAKPSVAAGGAVDTRLIPEVRHAVAVASGKGGVGKSTVAVNLAVSLARTGAAVGLLDADVYGPSIPIMMGIPDARPELDASGKTLIPFERFGIRFMSLGFLVDPQSAVIWRGPIVMKAIEQLLRDVDWGRLDYLILDLPPGTGDVQLTLSQRLRLAGAVIVTTPQDVALADAIKGVAMFRKVEVPILGIVENMSFFRCPHCAERSEIFGHGGGALAAERLSVPFLGEIPLDPGLRDSGDAGRPVVDAAPDSELAGAFGRIAQQVLTRLDPVTDGTEQPGVFDRFRKIWGDTGE